MISSRILSRWSKSRSSHRIILPNRTFSIRSFNNSHLNTSCDASITERTSRNDDRNTQQSTCTLNSNLVFSSRRSFSNLSSLQQAHPIPIINHSNSTSLIQQEDELLFQFDNPLPSNSTSIPTSSGLFLHPSLTSPQDFLSLTQKTLFRAQLLVSRIINAPKNGIEELGKVARNLDRLSDLLCGIIDFAELVRNASPDKNWVEAANNGYEYLCGYMNVLNTSTGLYDVLSQVLSTPSLSSTLSTEAKAVALVFLRDFEKSGIHLPPQQRAEFVKLSDEILVLGREFLQPISSNSPSPSSTSRLFGSKSNSNSNSIQEEKYIPLSWLEGMPISLLQALRQSAISISTSGIKELVIPLDSESWETQTILKYSSNEKAREKAYLISNSNGNPMELEKVKVLESLLKRRAELAKVTGNDGSYSRMTLGDKMAKRPEHVENFLRALSTHHRPLAEKNLELLRSLKRTRSPHTSSSNTFNAWDREFYSESLALQNSTRSPVMLSPYLSLGNIFRGLSRLFSKLYGISFKFSPLKSGETWSNKEVIKLEVLDEKEGLIGRVYCDLFQRDGKPSNAAHYTVRCSRRIDLDDDESDFKFGSLEDGRNLENSPDLKELANAYPDVKGEGEEVRKRRKEMAYCDRENGERYQTPVIVLMCDFVKPSVRNGPTLLNWNEVETLFHEMGHAIHSMIGRTEYHNVSGTRCATDFVELPSILMEHFLISPSVLPLFTSHQSSGKPLTPEILSNYLSTSKSLSSLDTHHQILLASLDQLYHSPKALSSNFDSSKELFDLANKHDLIKPAGKSNWQINFGHLFGYGASYYSYLFDRAIANKVFKEIFEKDPLDRRNGEVFKEKVLRYGGGKDAWEMLADLLNDERIRNGDDKAMEVVGEWGIQE